MTSQVIPQERILGDRVGRRLEQTIGVDHIPRRVALEVDLETIPRAGNDTVGGIQPRIPDPEDVAGQGIARDVARGRSQAGVEVEPGEPVPLAPDEQPITRLRVVPHVDRGRTRFVVVGNAQ